MGRLRLFFVFCAICALGAVPGTAQADNTVAGTFFPPGAHGRQACNDIFTLMAFDGQGDTYCRSADQVVTHVFPDCKPGEYLTKTGGVLTCVAANDNKGVGAQKK